MNYFKYSSGLQIYFQVQKINASIIKISAGHPVEHYLQSENAFITCISL